MNVKMLIRDNWKGAVAGIIIAGAAMYGGPIAGKAAGVLVPKALTHISNTPVTDLRAHKSPFASPAPPPALPGTPRVSTPLRDGLYRATLAQVARDFGITGRLDCRVVPK